MDAETDPAQILYQRRLVISQVETCTDHELLCLISHLLEPIAA